MPGALMNMFTVTVADGNDFPIPAGFLFASINPSAGASFTITNSAAQTTGAIESTFSFPGAGSNSWAEHTVEATGGSVEVVWATGN